MPIVVEQKVNAMISNALEVLVVKSNQNWLHQPSVTWGHILDLISFHNVSIKVEKQPGGPHLLSLALIIPPNWHLVLALICIIPPWNEKTSWKERLASSLEEGDWIPIPEVKFTWRYRSHVGGDVRKSFSTASNTLTHIWGDECERFLN